jgi:low affinity Fe/Cu permease
VLRHPADRTERASRGRFENLAEQSSFLASSPVFFVVCFGVVGAWGLGWMLGASDRFEAGAAGLMSAMTLLLVALLKNAELRGERAIQRKLDAIASSLLDDRRGDDADAADRLAGAIGVHEQI